MTTFSTCTGCKAKGDCEHAAAIKKAVKGMFVTSIKHRCAHRDPLFKPGDPVTVETWSCMNDPDAGMEYFPGIFIAQKATKAICFIKPGTDGFETAGKGYVKVTLSRIKTRDGDRVDVRECEFCGERPALTGHGFGCSERRSILKNMEEGRAA